MGFWVVGLNPTIHNNIFFRLSSSISNLKNTLPGVPRKWNRLDIEASAHISGRPAIPPFQGGKRVIRLRWGKLLVNLLQVVKRAGTPTKSLTTKLCHWSMYKTSLITGQYKMIVIELAELLSEWWFPLSTNPSRADQSNTRRLGYTVRDGIEGVVKWNVRVLGLSMRIKIQQRELPHFFSCCNHLEGFLNGGLDLILWCWRCIRTSAS